MEDESHTNYKDTVPLLGGHASPSLRAADRSQAMTRVDRKSKPVILGLDRVMTTSVYSDKMQVSGDNRHPISLLHVYGKDNTVTRGDLRHILGFSGITSCDLRPNSW